MTLRTHIENTGGACRPDDAVVIKIARGADCSASTLYMIAMGHKRPSPHLAMAIEAATGGVVSKESLRPDIWGAQAGLSHAA